MSTYHQQNDNKADGNNRLVDATIENAVALVWQAGANIKLVAEPVATPLHLLRAIDQQKILLLQNTAWLSAGYQVNNALLWGARGTGKSSLIKAVHQHVNETISDPKRRLLLAEINREDIATLPALLDLLRRTCPQKPTIIFCDDLSFDKEDTHYKSLKSLLDGGIEARPKNIVFYATSNRRHLMARDLSENQQADDMYERETAEEKISLSDRFGLWLGFYRASEQDYLEMVGGFVKHYQLPIMEKDWRPRAVEWGRTRGAVSGRTAFHFILHLAASLGHRL